MHLQSILQLLIAHRYTMLLILALIEGPLVCLCAGVMIHFGYFLPIPAFIIVMIGDIVPNSVSFFLGKLGNRKTLAHKLLGKLGITEHHFETLEKFWVAHTHKTMFLAKLAWGLGVPLFMSAGITKLSFKKFLWSMTWIAAVQYVILLWLGAYLGHSYNLIIASNNYIEIGGLVFSVLILIIVFWSLSRFAREKIINAE